MDNTLKNRVRFLVTEEIALVDYDPRWPEHFEKEAAALRQLLPADLVTRIEHFGSTAVPGLSAKPIIDILVEVTSLKETRKRVVPILQNARYEYLWRPVRGDHPPCYAWFIKRDINGVRTHHIHMVEHDSELWDRLHFRDYLRKFPEEADRYSKLKSLLAAAFSRDRVGYTERKTEYITAVTRKAKEFFA